MCLGISMGIRRIYPRVHYAIQIQVHAKAKFANSLLRESGSSLILTITWPTSKKKHGKDWLVIFALIPLLSLLIPMRQQAQALGVFAMNNKAHVNDGNEGYIVVINTDVE